MSEPKDPERLLADALRAQAVFAPQVEHVQPDTPDTSSTGSGSTSTGASASLGTSGSLSTGSTSTGSASFSATDAVPTVTAGPAELPSAYGLLSGASADSLERERAALDLAEGVRTDEHPTVRQRPVTGSAPLPAYWILLLALLLGLAAGCVVGLLTLV